MMRSNDPELKTTVFCPFKVTPAEGDIPAVMSTCQPTVIFSANGSNLRMQFSMCVWLHLTLNALVRQYRYDKDSRAVLLHVRMAVETEYLVSHALRCCSHR